MQLTGAISIFILGTGIVAQASADESSTTTLPRVSSSITTIPVLTTAATSKTSSLSDTSSHVIPKPRGKGRHGKCCSCHKSGGSTLPSLHNAHYKKEVILHEVDDMVHAIARLIGLKHIGPDREEHAYAHVAGCCKCHGRAHNHAYLRHGKAGKAGKADKVEVANGKDGAHAAAASVEGHSFTASTASHDGKTAVSSSATSVSTAPKADDSTADWYR